MLRLVGECVLVYLLCMFVITHFIHCRLSLCFVRIVRDNILPKLPLPYTVPGLLSFPPLAIKNGYRSSSLQSNTDRSDNKPGKID